jgi:hypothetical protein
VPTGGNPFADLIVLALAASVLSGVGLVLIRRATVRA